MWPQLWCSCDILSPGNLVEARAGPLSGVQRTVHSSFKMQNGSKCAHCQLVWENTALRRMTVPLPPPQSGNEQAPVALLDGPLREASALVCSCSHSRSLESWPAWRGLMSAWFRENWQACGARRTGHAKDVKGLALVGIIYAVLSLPHLSEAACAKRRRARPRALEVALARVLRRPLRHHIQQASAVALPAVLWQRAHHGHPPMFGAGAVILLQVGYARRALVHPHPERLAVHVHRREVHQAQRVVPPLVSHDVGGAVL
mmetsp:Transcript_22472/g.42844  ORF Transcript_22472/g.42844 Transcript_22472/m.42844 type:complete len:259 (-) Transcript_22472:138-914(-)